MDWMVISTSLKRMNKKEGAPVELIEARAVRKSRGRAPGDWRVGKALITPNCAHHEKEKFLSTRSVAAAVGYFVQSRPQ